MANGIPSIPPPIAGAIVNGVGESARLVETLKTHSSASDSGQSSLKQTPNGEELTSNRTGTFSSDASPDGFGVGKEKAVGYQHHGHLRKGASDAGAYERTREFDVSVAPGSDPTVPKVSVNASVRSISTTPESSTVERSIDTKVTTQGGQLDVRLNASVEYTNPGAGVGQVREANIRAGHHHRSGEDAESTFLAEVVTPMPGQNIHGRVFIEDDDGGPSVGGGIALPVKNLLHVEVGAKKDSGDSVEPYVSLQKRW